MPVAREVRAAASARSDVFPVSEGEALPFVDKRYVLPSRSPLLAKRRSFGPAPCHRLPCDTKKNGWMTEKPDRCPRSSGRVPYLTGQGDTARATGRPSGFCSRSQGTRYVGGVFVERRGAQQAKAHKKRPREISRGLRLSRDALRPSRTYPRPYRSSKRSISSSPR